MPTSTFHLKEKNNTINVFHSEKIYLANPTDFHIFISHYYVYMCTCVDVHTDVLISSVPIDR
jgi:hypothetical protein